MYMTTTNPTQATAIITGGIRGLGLGIAKRLAAQGRQIILWDIDIDGFDRDQYEKDKQELESACPGVTFVRFGDSKQVNAKHAQQLERAINAGEVHEGNGKGAEQ